MPGLKREMMDKVQRLHHQNIQEVTRQLESKVKIVKLEDYNMTNLHTIPARTNDINGNQRYKKTYTKQIDFTNIDFDAMQDGVYDKMNIIAEQIELYEDDDNSKYRCVMFSDDSAPLLNRNFLASRNPFLRGLLKAFNIDLNNNTESTKDRWMTDVNLICDILKKGINNESFTKKDDDFYIFAILARISYVTQVRPVGCKTHDFKIQSKTYYVPELPNELLLITFTEGKCNDSCGVCLSLFVVYAILVSKFMNHRAYKLASNFGVFDDTDDIDLVLNFATILYDRFEMFFEIPETTFLDVLPDMVYTPEHCAKFSSLDIINVFDQASATKAMSMLLTLSCPQAFKLYSVTLNSKSQKPMRKLALKIEHEISDSNMALIIKQISMHYPKIFMRFGISSFSLSPICINSRNGTDSRNVLPNITTLMIQKNNYDRLSQRSMIDMEPDAQFQSNMLDVNVHIQCDSLTDTKKKKLKVAYAKAILNNTKYSSVFEPNDCDSRVRMRYDKGMDVKALFSNINSIYTDVNVRTRNPKRDLYLRIGRSGVDITILGDLKIYATIKYPANTTEGLSKVICLTGLSVLSTEYNECNAGNLRTNRLVPF